MPVIIVLLVAADQAVKVWALNNLKPVLGGITVINGFFSLIYVENRGAAFGILQNMQLPLGIFSFICVVFGLYLVYANKITSRYYLMAMTLIIAGGFGNFIDRVFRRYVIDMFAFTFINFPVFNVADSCVVIGSISLIILIMFDDIAKSKGLKKQ